MRIEILTLFPEMFVSPFADSIIKRAVKKDLIEIYIHNIRDFTHNKHKQVDDYAFGGGAGMVMKIEPIAECIRSLMAQRNYDEVIFMTPDGEVFNQMKANYFSTLENIIILCGHYKGIDERIRELFITKEISIGDYVLSGGEIPAMAFSDAIIRLIPGVLSDETSALNDSFQNGLLSAPVYTRPADFEGLKVPDVLLSGNEKEIEKWRMEKSIEKTEKKRPELLK